ncbi:hypothetical protein U9M48_025096 [Paspalum notatum var. saurae]|uniref:Uncharacterized protein n=1 Tax=Paspalum notatum var. saurae TaxID=547442 RepID=A0AAQ3WXW8_PASNO
MQRHSARVGPTRRRRKAQPSCSSPARKRLPSSCQRRDVVARAAAGRLQSPVSTLHVAGLLVAAISNLRPPSATAGPPPPPTPAVVLLPLNPNPATRKRCFSNRLRANLSLPSGECRLRRQPDQVGSALGALASPSPSPQPRARECTTNHINTSVHPVAWLNEKYCSALQLQLMNWSFDVLLTL